MKIFLTVVFTVVLMAISVCKAQNAVWNFNGVTLYPFEHFTTLDTSTVTVTPDSPTICQGNSVLLIAKGATSYKWSPAMALSDTTGDSVYVNPITSTTYTLKGFLNGRTYIVTIPVTVFPPPQLTVNSPSAVCSGDSVSLSVSGAATYTWFPSTGLSDTTGAGIMAAPSVTTTYFVTGLNIIDGCSSTDSVVVTILTTPSKPSFTQHGDSLESNTAHNNQWYRNDTLLADDTSQYIIITQPGEYKVIVSNNNSGCTATSDSAYIKPAGINLLSNISNKLSIYPNPFSNTISVQINTSITELQNWNLQVTDILGRIVYFKYSLGYYSEINLSGCSKGVYFVTVINGADKAVMPVFKQ